MRVSGSVSCIGFSETIFLQCFVDSGTVYPFVPISSFGRNLVWKLVSYLEINFASGKSGSVEVPNAVNCCASERHM
jgi:hypothetical protein